MAKLSKRVRAFKEKVEPGKLYAFDEAVGLLKEFATVKFSETVELAVNLGIDAKKSDQAVRGATTLPHGTGSNVRVAVFTSGENAEKATAAGADLVGMEDLAEQVKAGEMNFDVVIASPDAMRVVGQLGQILGPRGLMPKVYSRWMGSQFMGEVASRRIQPRRFVRIRSISSCQIRSIGL